MMMNIVAEAKDPLSPIPQDSQPGQHPSSTFKPGVGIVVGVMTLMFSLTFLFLLYIKHCSGGNTTTTTTTASGGGISASRAVLPSGGGRKNSGIDRSVVESLPIFRFGSLRGQKEGLDCAVCLSKFEATEVLRLLPKCKHAFHVECVDTWLDAHSTCPLCRCRVDPEDILLVIEKNENNQRNNKEKEGGGGEECCLDLERGGRNDAQRRHSSVGEREWEKERRKTTSSFRRSLDSSTSSASRIKKNYESVGVGIGCFVRPRKDGTLLTRDDTEEEKEEMENRGSVERRLEHRIIVSPSPRGTHLQHQRQRWSDVQPCDLLYLTSEMIISSESRRVTRIGNHRGRGIMKSSRSVSEITGLSRFPSSKSNNNINNNNNNNNNGTGAGRGEQGLLLSLSSSYQSHEQQQPTAVR